MSANALIRQICLLVFLYHTILSQRSASNFTLKILHVNDFHARFEQTSVYSGRCSQKDANAGNCYGGLARLKSEIDLLKKENPNTVFLSAGDYFQGTVWYTVFKWRVMAHFLNLLPHDAMCLGNHEFDDNVPGLVPFLKNASFPVLAANIDTSREPTMEGLVKPSTVLTVDGRKIGIIGYVTTDTTFIANPGKVTFLDEIQSVEKEAKKLKESGVNIIIALGHVGFQKDLEVAKKVTDVDVVIGGHSNTFLYNGEVPSVETSMGNYPTVVTQENGRMVPVVQAYAYGKYLGNLDVTFDSQGEAISYTGNPILLDGSYKQDPVILAELVPWKKELQSVIQEKVGQTYVFLDGDRNTCRMRECNMGNVITDAMVHHNAAYPSNMEWGLAGLAVMQGGGIRSSIDERTDDGAITMDDIMTVQPFQNTVDIVELSGKHVREMFEFSVHNYDVRAPSLFGGFLQVSGFAVTYDINKPPGKRVVGLQARCLKCRIPMLLDVNDTETYKVAMSNFLATGGDGYNVIKDNIINHHLTGLLDTDLLSTYIRKFSPIIKGIENRILFSQSGDQCDGKHKPELPVETTTVVNSGLTTKPTDTADKAEGTEVEEAESIPSPYQSNSRPMCLECLLICAIAVIHVQLQ